jgi:CBS domain-containing protein
MATEQSKGTTGSPDDKKYINSSVVFVHQDTLIQDVVLEMIKNSISSVMVEDSTGHIVGIVTERDIVRKFTLLNIEDKLTRTVGTIMTRPVTFVQLKDFQEQIVKLHLEQRIRHFPILSGPENRRENLVGIVSITDVARHYMLQEQGKRPEKSVDEKSSKPVVGVISSQRNFTNSYISLFNKLGFDAREVMDLHHFAMDRNAEKYTVILDMDGYSDKDIHELIPIAVKAKFHLIVTTSQAHLVPIFKKFINHDHQEIAMKPIDIGYMSWLILNKWHMPKVHSK